MIYGYIRVSSKDQNPKRQYRALFEEGVKEKNIYLDVLSGKNFSRPSYQKLVTRLKRGDLLIVKSIDRLGRNYEEILEQWQYITKKVGADIQILDMPLLNTKSEKGDLTGVFIADLVLQILAYVAQTEREFIRQRQAEGIAVAKASGIHFGCRRASLPDEFEIYFERWKKGEISVRKAAEMLQMSHTTFYRRCKEKLNNDIK